MTRVPRAGEFEADIALAPAEGGFLGEVRARWNIGDKPNGGYLMAMATNAMLAASGRPDPLSVTADYVSPPEAGPVAVTTETVRAGRHYATLSASLVQGDRERLRLLGALGDLSSMSGPTRLSASPPELEAPERCVALVDWQQRTGRPVTDAMRRYDLRVAPDSPWVGSGSGAAGPEDDRALEITGWIRFSDGAEPQVLGLLAFSDAFPPTVANSVEVGWVPTIELTVHVRGRPGPGWVLGSFRTRFLVDGLLEQDGELWSAGGRLLAQSRQLALVLPRRSKSTSG